MSYWRCGECGKPVRVSPGREVMDAAAHARKAGHGGALLVPPEKWAGWESQVRQRAARLAEVEQVDNDESPVPPPHTGTAPRTDKAGWGLRRWVVTLSLVGIVAGGWMWVSTSGAMTCQGRAEQPPYNTLDLRPHGGNRTCRELLADPDVQKDAETARAGGLLATLSLGALVLGLVWSSPADRSGPSVHRAGPPVHRDDRRP